MTHSYSSTVIEALRGMNRRETLVYATDSYPGGEGRRTRRRLREMGFRVRRTADSDSACIARQVDAVLVGADAVIPGHGIINKVGTLGIARAARRSGRPVIVLAQKDKRFTGWPEELPIQPVLELLDSEELFEFCPIELIDTLVSV